MKAFTLPPYPDSWYCVGKSSSFKKGQLKVEPFCGQEIVVFRGENNEVSAIDPYCSHMGAHLGKGGKVIENTVRCPFHGFRFDGKGECVKTEYDCAPPKNAKIKHWPVNETNGLIFVYYSFNNETPNYQITPVNDQEYMPLLMKSWVVDTHAQEVVENAVDVGHANPLHHYDAVTVVERVEVKGPLMEVAIRVERQKGLMGHGKSFTMCYTITAHGLGCSSVDIYLPDFDIRVQGYVMPRPINENQIILQVATQVHKECKVTGFNALLGFMPKVLVNHLLNISLYFGYIHDMKQDIVVWNSKIYLDQPRLTPGDGPISKFRAFSKQFYQSALKASNTPQKKAEALNIPVTQLAAEA